MKQHRLALLIATLWALSSGISLLSCGDFTSTLNIPGELPACRGTVGPEGGVIDCRHHNSERVIPVYAGLTLEVPEGAVDQKVEISVRPWGMNSEVLVDGSGLPLFSVVDIEPSGLVFRKPATLTMQYYPSDMESTGWLGPDFTDIVNVVGGPTLYHTLPTISRTKNSVSCEIEHFSKYALTEPLLFASEDEGTANGPDMSKRWILLVHGWDQHDDGSSTPKAMNELWKKDLAGAAWTTDLKNELHQGTFGIMPDLLRADTRHPVAEIRYNTEPSIRTSACALKRALVTLLGYQKDVEGEAKPAFVIAHSMGGLVARAYTVGMGKYLPVGAQNEVTCPNSGLLFAMATLSTPHGGGNFGDVAPGWSDQGTKDLGMNDGFLEELNTKNILVDPSPGTSVEPSAPWDGDHKLFLVAFSDNDYLVDTTQSRPGLMDLGSFNAGSLVESLKVLGGQTLNQHQRDQIEEIFLNDYDHFKRGGREGIAHMTAESCFPDDLPPGQYCHHGSYQAILKWLSVRPPTPTPKAPDVPLELEVTDSSGGAEYGARTTLVAPPPSDFVGHWIRIVCKLPHVSPSEFVVQIPPSASQPALVDVPVFFPKAGSYKLQCYAENYFGKQSEVSEFTVSACLPCGEGLVCQDGACVPTQEDPCVDLPKCQGDVAIQCVGGAPETVDCGADGKVCAGGHCLQEPCEVDCSGKVCGEDDGCGGMCTACAAGYTCTEAGDCVDANCDPPCAVGQVCDVNEGTGMSECVYPGDTASCEHFRRGEAVTCTLRGQHLVDAGGTVWIPHLTQAQATSLVGDTLTVQGVWSCEPSLGAEVANVAYRPPAPNEEVKTVWSGTIGNMERGVLMVDKVVQSPDPASYPDTVTFTFTGCNLGSYFWAAGLGTTSSTQPDTTSAVATGAVAVSYDDFEQLADAGKVCIKNVQGAPEGSDNAWCQDGRFHVVPKCGNNAPEADEECDGTEQYLCDDPKTKLDCDQSTCTWIDFCPTEFCGNHLVEKDIGEECEDNETQMCADGTTVQTCNPETCQWSFDCPAELCGNGQKDPGEDCEGNETQMCADGTTVQTCNPETCQWSFDCPAEFCGNGQKDPGEDCEGNETQMCADGTTVQTCNPETCQWSFDCPAEFCGNGQKDPGEDCEGNETQMCADGTTVQTCDVTCHWDQECPAPAVCGDGVCDAGTESPLTCVADCGPASINDINPQLFFKATPETPTLGCGDTTSDAWHDAGGGALPYWQFASNCGAPPVETPEQYNGYSARYQFTTKAAGSYNIGVWIPSTGSACGFAADRYSIETHYTLARASDTNLSVTLDQSAYIGASAVLFPGVALKPGNHTLYLYDDAAGGVSCNGGGPVSIRVFADHANVSYVGP